MKKYTAPKMEILTPEMGFVTYEPYYGPYKIIRVISEDFSKIDSRVLEEKYQLDFRDPCICLYLIKQFIEDEQRKIAIEAAMTTIEEDPTASAQYLLKHQKAKTRRLDAKFKAKNFKKAHRLATDPKTGKQDVDQMGKFYEGKQNKRHPGRNRHTQGKQASLEKAWSRKSLAKNSWEQEVDEYAREEEERLFGVFEIKIKLMGYGIII